ncbi:MAG: carbamoyltransferase HypF [Pirellulaceae bacterium]|nr:carbamoyltransferase HypF [Pirellulaceae bacterium]
MPATRVILSGRVQGLGVRPAIYRLAESLELSGTVRNTAGGVEILVEGDATAITQFLESLAAHLPAGTQVEQRREQVVAATGCVGFAIVEQSPAGPLAARVPADRAVCDGCLDDVLQSGGRRQNYPLTSCTLCGPRYSIVRRMPYARQSTSMADFPLCDACQNEFTSPGDRRFHAETNACPACGPRVTCHAGDSRQAVVGEQALELAGQNLRDGRIVAVRGLGGYQLLVDATCDDAVRRLRQRKTRPARPLAVMVRSLAEAHRLAILNDTESRLLASAENPIVLVRARSGNGLAKSVHPGLDCVGLLLPTTPLHALLLRIAARPVVCTSGNREGEPLEYDVAAAEANLHGICDVWLHHDRPIEQPVDDSVVRVIADRPVALRLARGYAPWPLQLPGDSLSLALGGQMKSAAAWSNGGQAVLGPHLGDLESEAVRERLLWQLARWRALYQFQEQSLAHDLHPDYFTTWLAQQASSRRLAVQHHHAHIVAGMLEQQWLDREVIGVAWDGTGYGSDGTVWGGELLRSTAARFERIGWLRPFVLPGGEAAIRQPWRVALALLHQVTEPNEALAMLPGGLDRKLGRQVQQLIASRVRCPVTSSAGRLFDAAAVLILGLTESEYDGQPAMLLEAVADRTVEGAYPLVPHGDEPLIWDWRPMLRQLLADRRRGEEPPALAMRWHRGLAAGIVHACRRWPQLPVVLGGGVFQNQLLVELIGQQWRADDAPLGLPGMIPPNDGGLAAGQLAVLAASHT